MLIVLAANVWLTFVGWELAGVSSYALIAYAYDRPVAAAHASRVLITNRLGDAGLLLLLTWFAVGYKIEAEKTAEVASINRSNRSRDS